MPTNPLAVAAKGKGHSALLTRSRAILRRYGFTPAKMDRSIGLLVSILREFGCRATLPVTTKPLARHSDVIERYQAQGIEFAMHGLVHVDHTQLAPDDQRDYCHRGKQIFEQVSIRTSGFRCPYLRWNADTLRVLAECGFTYDSSQALVWDVTSGFETEGYHRVLGFYRAEAAADHTALPRIINDLVRIPYCIPDDEALVERLRLTDAGAMTEIWQEMLCRIHQAGELFTLGLHPERVMLCQEALRATLEKARSLSPHVWMARLDEIAAWWRALSQTTFEVSQNTQDEMRFCVNAPPDSTLLVRAVDVGAPIQQWARGYGCVSANKFSFQSSVRPFIGLAPNSSSDLQSFLRQQGYLVEISTESQRYPLYLEQMHFTPEDERPLLSRIEDGAWPLIRLSRWPSGAHSALCVTGDIDSFTLWDYGLRFIGG